MRKSRKLSFWQKMILIQQAEEEFLNKWRQRIHDQMVVNERYPEQPRLVEPQALNLSPITYQEAKSDSITKPTAKQTSMDRVLQHLKDKAKEF